jgi:hypothetical protein
MSKIKTVVNCNIDKLHSLIQSDNWKASFADEQKDGDGAKGIIAIDSNNVRLNLYQKEDVSPEDYRAWVKKTFASPSELKSMY